MKKKVTKQPLFVGVLIFAFIVATLFFTSRSSAQTNSSISGIAWRDIDANSLRGASEPTLQGALVTLYDGSNMAIAGPIATDMSGAYSFSGLGADTYRVEIVAPGNFLVNSLSIENDFAPVIANNRVGETNVVVDGANNISNIDAAIRPKSMIWPIRSASLTQAKLKIMCCSRSVIESF